MFRRLDEPSPESVTLTIEGSALTVAAGISVAAALLQAGTLATRTSAVKQTPRAPYCMMGVCFECLVEIDGAPNQQACMRVVAEGMIVKRQLGAPAMDPR